MAEKTMQRYEALLLAVPEITADESSTLESQIHDLISKNKGETLSFERWGKYRLAYEIRKNEYGVYFLTRFSVPHDGLATIHDKLHQLFAVKYSDIVMRHVVKRLEADQSLEYKRPESLEEAPPRRDGDSFRRGARGPSRRFADRSSERPAERSSQAPATEKQEAAPAQAPEQPEAAPAESVEAAPEKQAKKEEN